jgi:hypothetical protein
MIKLYILLFSLLTLSFSQDRSLIFNAGPPDTQEGYLLSSTSQIGTTMADRFYVSSDYVLEAFAVYLKLVESDSGSVTVKIHEDANNAPGELVYSWGINLDPTDLILDDYLVVTVGECHTMYGQQNYWLSVSVNEPNTQVLWGYSPSQLYYTTSSQDDGNHWTTPVQGYAGAARIWAEQIYYPGEIEEPAELGDVNLDAVVNVLDVVQMVNYILGNLHLNDEQQAQADFNEDEVVNILDVVQTVNYILAGGIQYMPKFMAEDINPNSQHYGEYIGPDTFTGDISCYYFGKAG